MQRRFRSSMAWRMAFAIILSVSGVSGMVQAQTELSFWYWFSPHEEPQLLSIVRSFEDAYGVRVVTTNVASGGGNYVEKLLTAFAGGAGPDVYFVAPGHMRTLLSDPIALDLTTYVDRDRSDIDFEDFIEAQHLELQYRGKWKCLPYDFSVLAFYYNKEVFNRSGVPYPEEGWSWGDYAEYGRKLTAWDSTGQVTRWALGSSGAFEGLWSEGTYQSFGGELFSFGPNGLISVANNDGVIRTFGVLQELVQTGVMPRPGEPASFFAGEAAITVAGSWNTIDFRNAAEFDFDVAMLPAAHDGNRVITGSGGCWAVSATTSFPEEAWELVKWLSSVEGINAFVVDPLRSIPARKSLMIAWIERIQEGQLPPQSAAIFVDSVLKYGKNPSLVEFPFGEILTKYVQQVRNEAISPVEAAEQLERELNAEIQRVYSM